MYDTDIQRTSKAASEGVVTSGLGKRYDDMWAVRDVDLAVAPGTVLGLLGHNGAGKTTTIRMLTTLSTPTEGTASVAGFDVVSQASAVRSNIGIAGQSATVDGLLSGRMNLEMIGRLNHMSKAQARERAGELLELFHLTDAASKLAKAYSGGMRRRLDLAASMITRAPVLFLDEPTTGLDPQSRNELWTMLEGLVAEGTTLVLTTQYLEEADRLANEVVVLDQGKIVAAGAPSELKARHGGERMSVSLRDPRQVSATAEAMRPFATGALDDDREAGIVTAPIAAQTSLIEVVRALDSADIDASDIRRREATLDDVFLSLTGSKGVKQTNEDQDEKVEVSA